MGGVTRRLRHDLGYLALRAFLGAARPAPLGLLRSLGSWLGRVAATLAARDRARALDNLRLAFPQQDDTWRSGVARSCARHLGTTVGEIAWLWSVAPATLLEHTEMNGLEELGSRLGQHRGAVLVTAHCGNWEWMNLALGAAGIPMSVAAREVYDPRLDEVARRLRGRFGGETILRGEGAGQRLVQALHRGRVVGLLIDQDIEAPGAFVEFFGRPAWTPTGAATLALRTGSPVVAGFAARLPDGRMRLTFSLAASPERTRDVAEATPVLTAALTARIERQIRDHPEQWVWMHRRWRREPGEGDRVWSAGPAPAEPR